MPSDAAEVSGLESVWLLSNGLLCETTERRILTMARQSNFFPSFLQFSFVSAETLAPAGQYMRSDAPEVSGLESVWLLSNGLLCETTERRILTMARQSNFSRRFFNFRLFPPKL